MICNHVATIEKNKGGAEVRVTVQIFKRRRVLDVRVWYQTDGGNFVPTRKGITIDVDKLPALSEAIAEAARMIGRGDL